MAAAVSSSTSVAEVERAGEEAPDAEVSFARDPRRASHRCMKPFAPTSVSRLRRHTLMPAGFLASGSRLRVEDGVGLIDRLMMERFPAEIDAMRRASLLADERLHLLSRSRAAPAARNTRSSPKSKRCYAGVARPTTS